MVFTRSTAWNLASRCRSHLGLICFLAVAVSGCYQQEKPPTPPSAPLTAEERFENFLTALKELVETHDSFSSSGEGQAAASASWDGQVSHQLIPAADGKPLRAVLSIHRKSEVTVLLPESNAEEDEAKALKDEKQLALAKEFVPELVEATGAGNSGRIASSSIRTLPDHDVSQYEMQYNGERWEVLTPLDSNEKPFTVAAIKLALDRQ